MIFFKQQPLAVVIFLALISFRAQAQAVIVDDTLNLRKGVYRSFKEFKYNFPTLLDSFTITSEQKKLVRSIPESKDSATHTVYHVLLPDHYNESHEVWGYCDGQYVYITTGQAYHTNEIFEKVDYLGRYCLFFQWTPPTGSSPGTKPASQKTTGYLSRKIVNINNGQVFNPDELNHTYLTTILAKDNALFEKYKKDKDRNAKTFYYLKQYSEKHKDEIKP